MRASVGVSVSVAVAAVVTSWLAGGGGVEAQAVDLSGSAFRVPGSEVDRLLTNPRYVRQELNCVLDLVRCDQTGLQLKQVVSKLAALGIANNPRLLNSKSLPEVLQRNCKQCTREQLVNALKIINFVRNNYPNEFNQIVAKYGQRG